MNECNKVPLDDKPWEHKNQTWGCIYCSIALNSRLCHLCCCQGTYVLCCSRCEEIIPDSEEFFERDETIMGGGKYCICRYCHESID